MNSPPPAWKRLRSQRQLDFKILSIREDWVLDPRNGSEYPRVIIDAPDWVNVIPVTTDLRVVMIRQFRFGVWAQMLEIPGGMVELGEEPIQAARRELEEETGYRPAEIALIGTVHPNPAIQSNCCFSFLASGCQRIHQGAPEPGEDLTIELFDRAAVPGLIANGEIKHALVVAAFMFERLRAERA
jgi:8-oxo-dGTP pyrophosphatase MutT (NUDIX family)